MQGRIPSALSTAILAAGICAQGNIAQAGGEFSVGGYFKSFSIVELLPEYQRTLLGWPDAPAMIYQKRCCRLNF